MSSAVLNPPAQRITFDDAAKVRVALLVLAFAAVFYNELINLFYEWSTSSDWSHGPIIPLFSIYLIYSRWSRVRKCEVRHNWVGAVLLIGGLLWHQVSIWFYPIGYFKHVAMLVCVLGLFIWQCGLLVVLRHGWVPWLYLFFAIPLPRGVYFALTDPLRQIAAVVATGVLSLFPELHIERIGSTIEYFYNGQQGNLGVADACSGMRSTITLCALGVAIAFISDRPVWQRAVLVAICVPIAVFSNFIRVTVTCILHIFVDPEYASGNYHMALGLVTLGIAFAIFSGLAWLLNNLVVPAEDEPDAAGERNSA